MKRLIRIMGVTFLLLTVVNASCWSMDFVNMNNEELFDLRGAVQNAPEADKKAYQAEWEKRVASMTDDEKKQFAEISAKEKKDDDALEQPRTPAQGYEKQGVQGQVIFGGFPQNSGSAR